MVKSNLNKNIKNKHSCFRQSINYCHVYMEGVFGAYELLLMNCPAVVIVNCQKSINALFIYDFDGIAIGKYFKKSNQKPSAEPKFLKNKTN